jgi:hypothetical protein
MPLRKTAFALPEELLSAIDQAAEARSVSRNRFVIRVLQEAVHARRDAEVTQRLNELFSDPAFAAEQAGTASALDAAGTEWNDERW